MLCLFLERTRASASLCCLIFCRSLEVWKWKILPPDEQASSTISIGIRPRLCVLNYYCAHVLIKSQGRCHSAVVSGCNIIYFGGSLPSTNCLSVLDTRTFKSRQTIIGGNSVQKRLSHCAAVVDGSMIIVGGWSVNSLRASSTLQDCFQIQAMVSALSNVALGE